MGPFDPSVPKPESILGYGPGARHSTFRDMERVDLAIADAAKAKIKVIEYGKSWEGRPLRVFAVSSPKNMARLEEIRKAVGQLANPDPKADYTDLIAKTPPIVWINECIHGDETASFESGMWLLYTLAASKNMSVTDALENSVVILNPVFNPDGHERYVVYYNQFALGDPNSESFEHATPWIMGGRVNHYRFDMNRDHVTLSQRETRTETAEYRRWNPQVYVDQHGQVPAYFFPPNPMAINVNVDRARLNKWTEILGRATAAAFDKNGWLYMVKNEFDFYAPNYTDTWATLNGAIGMTHETDHGATIREKRNDGSVATLKGAVEKHFVSALAVIEASAKRRADLLNDFLKYKKDAVTGKLAGKFQRVVVQGGIYELARLQKTLELHGIRVQNLMKPIRFENAHSFWSDETKTILTRGPALVIDMAQPFGPLAKALLEPQSDFEPEFVKEQLRRRSLAKSEDPDPDAGNYEFYDLTAWSLIYGFGVQAWWCETALPIESKRWDEMDYVSLFPSTNSDDATGLFVPYVDRRFVQDLFQLQTLGVRIAYATRDIKSANTLVPRGSFLILRDRNEPHAYESARAWLATQNGFFGLSTAFPEGSRHGVGDSSIQAIKPPKLGVYFGDPGLPTQFGHVWYVLEKELRVPFTAMTARGLNGDLHDYTCLIFPGRAPALGGKLLEWVRNGGCAIVLGDASWLNGTNDLPKLETTKVDGKDPARLPGSLFLGSLDARSFLAYGLPSSDGKTVNLAVPVEGARYYKVVDKASSVLAMPPKPEDVRLLSGWTWPDETSKAVAGTTWLQVHDLGRGRVVCFMWDPTERAMYPGHWQLLLNAILFGPR